MGSMNRHLLAAALLSGMVIASRAGSVMNPAQAAAEIAPDFAEVPRRKVRSYGSKPCGAAAAKRAKAKRRNIAKHSRTAHRGARHG